jgi:hypothetical protein
LCRGFFAALVEFRFALDGGIELASSEKGEECRKPNVRSIKIQLLVLAILVRVPLVTVQDVTVFLLDVAIQNKYDTKQWLNVLVGVLPKFKIMVTSTEMPTELYAIVRGFVGKQIQDQDDCDDVVQKIFMKIQEKIAGLREMEKANAWFFTSAQNAIED